jgi:hypothetical protein
MKINLFNHVISNKIMKYIMICVNEYVKNKSLKLR